MTAGLAPVIAAIRRFRMIEPGQRVGVAVSGGADSVCLLHVLVELGSEWNLKLRVLHVDHRLRGEESAADAAFVGDLANRLNLPFDLTEIDGAALPGNLEQAARNARYDFFRKRIARGFVDRVALGHTRSDQAETVLFRFLRGSGTAGLAGIRPITRDGFIRPLIGMARDEAEAWLRERGIAWRTDSTNADCGFARNRIRHSLLPALIRDSNPELVETLAHMADWAREEEEYWDNEIDRLAAACLAHRPPAVFAKTIQLGGLPIAVVRRLARRAIEMAKGDLRSVDFQHAEAIRELFAGAKGHARVQIPGLDCIRSFDWVRLAPLGSGKKEGYAYPVTASTRFALPGSGSFMELTLEKPDSIYNEAVNCLDWDRLPDSAVLRGWKAGDQYRRAGHAGGQKIKELFQQSRIPIWERRGWPVIASADGRQNEIAWARNFGPGAEFAVTPETRRALLIRETGESWIGNRPTDVS